MQKAPAQLRGEAYVCYGRDFPPTREFLHIVLRLASIFYNQRGLPYSHMVALFGVPSGEQ